MIGYAGGQGGGGGEVDESEMKKGPWTAAEDAILMEYVKRHGEGNWNSVQKNSGLSRCGKSCRLRWANHLRPNLKKGAFSPDEERLILQLHAKLGNKWARMAAQLPGRTDNEIKNYWNTRIKRRLRQGLPLYPPDIQRQQAAMHAHRPPAPLPLSSLHLLDPATGAAPLGAFHAHSFIHDGGYINGAGHHLHFLPHTTSTSAAANESLFPLYSGHGQTHPFFHPGIHFGAAGTADPNLPDDLSIKLELPSSQNPDAGPSFIYERPVADLDAFLLDSGVRDDGERSSSLLDTQHHDKPSFVGWAGASTPPFMSMNPSSSDSVDWRSGSGHGGSDHVPIPPAGLPIRDQEEELTTLFNIMPAASNTGIGEWRSDSGEASNSALTDDDVSLELKQLASSETAAGRASLEPSGSGEKDWGLSSCSWNNMASTS